MGLLDGRRVVVTGGGSGIGRATAMRVAAEGAAVAVWDNRELPAKETAEAVGGVACVCDVSNLEDVQRAADATVDSMGGVDGLLNAAGIFRVDGGLESCSPETWNQVIATNLTGTFLVSKTLLPHLLRAEGSAAIVNIASIYGLRGLTEEAAYDASKGGVVNLTRQVALDLAPKGIRVNAVAPGEIDTPMMLAQLGDDETPEQLKARIAAAVPMRRVGKPEEVAAVIAFLLSDQASYVSGAIVPIDGGLMAG